MVGLTNTPDVRMGFVAVSRDCFPIELSRKRMELVLDECRRMELNAEPCGVVVETETDAMDAATEMAEKGVNAVTIYLGNFGPEGPATILAETLGMPFMLVGAAEEGADSLMDGRGDALCGMLSTCLNCGLRDLQAHIPDQPIGLPAEVAQNVAHFMDVARVVIGLEDLKVFAFGPRPQDFYACNAPIKPLYDLGIEVMENSELDLLLHFKFMADRRDEITAIVKDMEQELGEGNMHPEKLAQTAQFELALTTFFEDNLGSREFGVYANKCWPSFEPAFGFTPCYVNSRLATRGIPVACEVDIYGAVSEYMLQLASLTPATLLDINNTVPDDLEAADLKGAGREDLFMGFHCGNTPSCHLCAGFALKHQVIMHRLMEPDSKPDITCGTLEGTLKPGPMTLFRLQSTPEGDDLMSCLAEGHVLDADPQSFGSIGICAIPGFRRFYRHVLLERKFAHHTAVAFAHAGRVLFDAAKLLGCPDIATPLAAGVPYPGENPFG